MDSSGFCHGTTSLGARSDGSYRLPGQKCVGRLRAPHSLREPVRDRPSNGSATSQRVRARDAHDRAIRALRRHTERVALALDDERRHLDRIELREATLLWAARRVERKGEAQDGDRIGLSGGATRDPRAQRPTTGQNRQPPECVAAELGNHCGPGRVELAWLSRAASSSNPVGLLHKCDGKLPRAGRLARGDKVGRIEATAGAVPEHERTDG
jgi:hypothetical protein